MEQQTNKISFFSAVLMSLNIIIGIGIFIIPPLMAQTVGNLSFLGWALVSLIFVPVVYSISQITKYFPGQGSFFSYSEKELGKTAGFISGWFYFLGFISISAMVFISLKDILITQYNIEIIKNYPAIFNFILVLIFCLLNLLSLSHIGKIQNAVTIIKLSPLVLVIILGFFYYNPNLIINWQDFSMLKFTIPLTIFGFWGVESTCNISHLIKGNKNTPSKVILLSFFLAVGIYTLFHFSLINIMGAQNLIVYKTPSFINFLNLQNPFILNLLASFISIAMLIAYISSNFGILLANLSPTR